MKQKIAIPTSNGKLDAHFGHCRHFTLVDVEGENVVDTKLIDAPPHEHGLLPRWLAERNVTDVIAGGMGERAMQLLESRNIHVFAGAPVMDTQELVNKFLDNSLTFSPHKCHH
ncbi:MAG TPA: NifB/NifX family molybdenum-iron cluster-binding protein [Bacteroidales bacterium]|nr:NifB/NifX family molybdenum-iron cluster-binding protein [Bacteroidales bacterium]